MAQTITVTVAGKAAKEVDHATKVAAVVPSVAADGLPVLGAIVNNMVVPLGAVLICDATVTPLTIATPYGWDIYRATLCYLLSKTARKCFPDAEFRVHNSMGVGLYCTVNWEDASEVAVAKHVALLKDELAAVIARDAPIVCETLSYQDAFKLFGKRGMFDELHLLKHRNPPIVLVQHCEDHYALNQQTLAPRAGAVDVFDLIPYGEGMILNVPTCATPRTLSTLPPVEHLFRVYKEHIAWGEIMGITTIGQLNAAILEKRMDDFIRTAEALHAKKLGEIADEITRREPRVRLVLVAGPSSAGKTTTAKRLMTQLRVNGWKPILISTDNYFVGDDLNPRDENGNLDYEHIHAMDLKRLNADLLALMAGKKVTLRHFDFKRKEGYDAESTTQLPANGIIVMEGIHCLNPQLTPDVPRDQKFLLYLNALTQLGVDSCTRISTKDTRMLRRMVRDYQFRNKSARDTIRMWASIKRGEEKWIYPFQSYADAVFNSALDYELAVLKPFAIQLLNQVKPWDVEFIEARRLSGLLHNFSIARSDAVPGDSILRETIGGSQLDY